MADVYRREKVTPQTTILVVDDAPSNLFNLHSLLKKRGFLVSAANSGKDALNLLSRLPIDIAILDIEMPEMDGFALYSKMQGNPVWKTIPVLFVTADKEVEIVKKAVTMGAAGYIVKPYEESILIQRIKAIEKQAQVDQGAVFLIERLSLIVSLAKAKIEQEDSKPASEQKAEEVDPMEEDHTMSQIWSIFDGIYPELFNREISVLLGRLKVVIDSMDVHRIIDMTKTVINFLNKYSVSSAETKGHEEYFSISRVSSPERAGA
jgi:DNA-binding response OmpR family regulator